ncbi:MAG: alpha/beta fold hydrolase, partial [Solirubrobacterales bacterium]
MAEVGRRNGVYGGWTRAGNTRVFVRVPTQLKRQSAGHSNGSNDNGSRPELGTTPIVLVHGLSSSRTLKPLIKALGTRRPVYAPDLPGFGMSDQPIRPLDVPGLADALRRWMLDNKLAPAIVVGVAFGCQVAVHLAAAYPAAVDRLVLIGPTFDPEARSTA